MHMNASTGTCTRDLDVEWLIKDSNITNLIFHRDLGITVLFSPFINLFFLTPLLCTSLDASIEYILNFLLYTVVHLLQGLLPGLEK